jgi:hypothetical protein
MTSKVEENISGIPLQLKQRNRDAIGSLFEKSRQERSIARRFMKSPICDQTGRSSPIFLDFGLGK